MCGKSLKYAVNAFHVSKMAEISGKWLRNLRQGLCKWEITSIYLKWLKYMGNCFSM